MQAYLFKYKDTLRQYYYDLKSEQMRLFFSKFSDNSFFCRFFVMDPVFLIIQFFISSHQNGKKYKTGKNKNDKRKSGNFILHFQKHSQGNNNSQCCRPDY